MLKTTDKIAYPDIKVGIPAMLLSIEMAIFAVMHLFAFSWKPYDLYKNPKAGGKYTGGFLGWYAFLDAFNLWDVVKAAARGFRWLFVGARKREQDVSYEQHRNAMKLGNVESLPPPQQAQPVGGAPFYGDLGMLTENQRPRPPRRTDTQDSDSFKGLLTEQQSVPQTAGPGSYGYAYGYPSSRDSSPYREGRDQDYSYKGPFADPAQHRSEYHGR